MTYEFLRIYVTPEGQKNPTSYGKLMAGAVSGAVAQTCTYPLCGIYCPIPTSRVMLIDCRDVLRRRFQINKMKSMGYKYKSIGDAVRIIAAEEGFRGFYRGIGPNLLKVAPSMASSFLSFELARDFFVSLGDDEV